MEKDLLNKSTSLMVLSLCDVKVYSIGEYYNTESEIWTSEDVGKTWRRIYRSVFPRYIRKVIYVDNEVAYGLTGRQNHGQVDTFIAKTVDGCRSWIELGPMNNISNFRQAEPYSSGFIYLWQNSVFYYDAKEGTSTQVLREDGAGTKVMTHDRSGNIWILDKIGNKMHLDKLDREGQLQSNVLARDVTAGYPKSLHVDGSSISIFVSGGHSIFGVDHRFHHSNDAGVTWTEEDLPFPLIVAPCAYWGEDLVWATGFPGTIQFRNPKKVY